MIIYCYAKIVTPPKTTFIASENLDDEESHP